MEMYYVVAYMYLCLCVYVFVFSVRVLRLTVCSYYV